MPVETLTKPDVATAIRSLRADRGYASIQARLEYLMQDHDDYDEDYRKPTVAAFAVAKDLLKDAGLRLGGWLPEALAGPDGEGGIRIEWRRPPKSLILLVRSQSNGKHMIYHADGDGSAMAPATDVELAERLSAL